MSKFNAFREGFVHVMGARCKTCVFRRGNLMHIEPGRLAGMVKGATKKGTAIICHSTLGGKSQAVCRGFFDKHPTAPLQVAERLGVIKFQGRKS